MNLKDLIALGAFPLNENGFALVPINGGFGIDPDVVGPAQLFPILLPGPFCLVGIDPNGDLASWDENGRIQPVMPFDIVLNADEIEVNSLAVPPSVSRETFVLADHDDNVIRQGIETLDEARRMAGPFDQIMRVTETTFIFPNGNAAGGIEMEPVEVADFA